MLAKNKIKMKNYKRQRIKRAVKKKNNIKILHRPKQQKTLLI